MNDYFADLRLKWNHPDPKKLQLPPYKHTPIVYGAKIQYVTEPPIIPPLDDKGIFRFQSIVGAINDGCVLVGRNLTLFGVGVIPLESEVSKVVVHNKATGHMGVILSDIDAIVQITLHVFSDGIVLF